MASLLDNLPKALVSLRAAAGYRGEDVQNRAGVSASALSKYENGRKVPELATLSKLLDFYGADLRVLADAIDGKGVDALRERLKPKEEPKQPPSPPADPLDTIVGKETGVTLREVIRGVLSDLGLPTDAIERSPAPHDGDEEIERFLALA